MSRHSQRLCALLPSLLLGICWPMWSLDAQYTLAAGDDAGAPGETVTSIVVLDNAEPVRGFSFGIAHDGAVAAIVAIAQGAAVQDSNGGDGADYWFTDLDPEGGPGAIVGCILSLEAPIEDLAVATDNELALLDYEIDATAAPDSAIPLAFTDDLGSPAVVTVVSVAGVSFVPSQVSGTVTVLPPPVSGLACTASDACACVFSVTWTNEATYDSIEVREDGVLAATLAGTATSTSITTTIGVPVEVGITGIVGASVSAVALCTASCSDVPVPEAPTDLACAVNDAACEATLTWVNVGLYDSLAVESDGVVVATLPGSATSALVALGDLLPHELCVTASNACDEPSASVCCTAQCAPPPEFRRGDDNSDGSRDISDAIFTLTYLFADGASRCLDAMDTNDNGLSEIADPIYNLNFIFSNGEPPPAPYPDCGSDDTADSLGCDDYDEC